MPEPQTNTAGLQTWRHLSSQEKQQFSPKHWQANHLYRHEIIQIPTCILCNPNKDMERQHHNKCPALHSSSEADDTGKQEQTWLSFSCCCLIILCIKVSLLAIRQINKYSKGGPFSLPTAQEGNKMANLVLRPNLSAGKLRYIPTNPRNVAVNLRTRTVTQSKHSLNKEQSWSQRNLLSHKIRAA